MNTSSGRLSVVGLAVVLGFFVGACGGGDAEAGGDPGEGPSPTEASAEPGSGDGESESAPAEPSESESPAPVPASSEGPAQNWPEPEIPDAIYEESEDGALAALQYWFDTSTYLQLTGDPGPFEAISLPDCVICQRTTEQFDEVYNVESAWHVTENSSIENPLASTITSERDISILFDLSESPAEVYDASGERVLDYPGDVLEAEASLTFREDSWLIEEVAFFSDDGE